jgi:hypothetical protein
VCHQTDRIALQVYSGNQRIAWYAAPTRRWWLDCKVDRKDTQRMIVRIVDRWRQSMKSFNRLATCLLIAGLFSLSACVFAGPGGPGHDDRGERQAEVSGDHDHGNHDEADKNCGSDHQGDGCQEEHH